VLLKGKAKAGQAGERADFFSRLLDCARERLVEARLAWAKHIIRTRHGRRVNKIRRAFETVRDCGGKREVDFLLNVAGGTEHFGGEVYEALAGIGGKRALEFLISKLGESERNAFWALKFFQQRHPSPETDAAIEEAIRPIEKREAEMRRMFLEGTEKPRLKLVDKP